MKTITQMKKIALIAIIMVGFSAGLTAEEVMHSTNWAGTFSGWTVVNDVDNTSTWYLRSNDAGLEVVNTVEAASVEWFVSPQFNFSSGDTYTVEFERAWNDSQNGRLDVYYTENYTGDVNSATWQVIGEDIMNGQALGWSGAFVLYNATIPSTSASVRIAYKYTSAGMTVNDNGTPDDTSDDFNENRNRVRLKNFVLTTSGVNPIKLIPYATSWEYTMDDWTVFDLVDNSKTWAHKDNADTDGTPLPTGTCFITDSKKEQGDWLVSPVIDCSGNFQKEVKVTAGWQSQQSSNISLYYSTNYVGDQATATWETIGTNIIPETHDYGFATAKLITLSFPIDLIAPTAHFAIVYGPFKAPIVDDPDIKQNEIRVKDFTVQEFVPTTIDKEVQKLTFHPNPVSSVINLDITGDAVVEVYNLAGQRVKSVNLTANQVDVSDLPAGQYIIMVKQAGEVMVNKFLKK
jgi:hypothetical protein